MQLPLSRERLLMGLMGTDRRRDSMGRCLVVHLSARSGLQQTLQLNENRARSATRPPCTA